MARGRGRTTSKGRRRRRRTATSTTVHRQAIPLESADLVPFIPRPTPTADAVGVEECPRIIFFFVLERNEKKNYLFIELVPLNPRPGVGRSSAALEPAAPQLRALPGEGVVTQAVGDAPAGRPVAFGVAQAAHEGLEDSVAGWRGRCVAAFVACGH